MNVEQASSKKRLLLIQPVPTNKDLSHSLRATLGGKLPPLGLFVLDALTPKEWTVDIVDETVERFDIKRINTKTLSLIGISSWTNQAPRAYQIADAFRQQGVPVILGGPHPSVLPQEALQYADSVCIGEAESIWTRILADVDRGDLQQIYQGGRVPLEQLPIIRHPLRDRYAYGLIQTARGCPNNCDFCSVTTINGARIRYRPIEDVVEEFRHIKQIFVVVADDNFIGSGQTGRKRALNLCKALAELRRQGVRKFWGTQATQTLGQDDELLEWMYKAGCRGVLFGLESINPQVLQDVNKRINKVADFKKNIRNTQHHGITVVGSFVFGFDSDSPTVFDDTVRFIKGSGLAAQNLNTLCPLPGTKSFDNALRAGRLRYTNFPKDWHRYNLKEVVIEPSNCSALDLYKGRERAERQLVNKFTLLSRTLRTLQQTRSLSATIIALLWNLGGSLRMCDYREQIKQLEKETEMAVPTAV